MAEKLFAVPPPVPSKVTACEMPEYDVVGLVFRAAPVKVKLWLVAVDEFQFVAADNASAS